MNTLFRLRGGSELGLSSHIPGLGGRGVDISEKEESFEKLHPLRSWFNYRNGQLSRDQVNKLKRGREFFCFSLNFMKRGDEQWSSRSWILPTWSLLFNWECRMWRCLQPETFVYVPINLEKTSNYQLSYKTRKGEKSSSISFLTRWRSRRSSLWH